MKHKNKKTQKHQNKKIINTPIGRFCVLVFLCFFVFVANAKAVELGTTWGATLGLSSQDIRVTIANFIKVILGFLGMIAVLLNLYAGFLWMTAGGNSDKIEEAKKILVNAVVGLVIILSAYAITAFIINQIETSLGMSGGPSSSGPSAYTSGKALGAGIIESHYPGRGETGIARNTKIIVTFKERIATSTIIVGGGLTGDLEATNVKIYKTEDTISSAATSTEVTVATLDSKTFIFTPDSYSNMPKVYLGTSSGDTPYTVFLGSGIKKANGDDAFGGLGSYEWSFVVSSEIDIIPPKIISVIPKNSTTNIDRNNIVQINFNEAIDPISASGKTLDGFNNITANGLVLIPGTYTIANQYRTVEFITDDACGINSCGGTVYCLPASQAITVTAKAAAGVSLPVADWPYDGVVDVSGNSLDGNGNNIAEGPAVDNYTWNFTTNNKIDLTPPIIDSTDPVKGELNVNLKDSLKILFSKFIMSSSVNSSNILMSPVIGYWLKTDNMATSSRVYVYHEEFLETTSYAPQVTSGVKDIKQNCYQPCVGP